MRLRQGRPMGIGIDMAVERFDVPRAGEPAKFRKDRLATGEAQDEIESSETIGCDIEHRLAGELEEIPGAGVIGNVALVEDHVMSGTDQVLAQAAPQRCMAVAPGGGDRKPEDDDLHTTTLWLIREI